MGPPGHAALVLEAGGALCIWEWGRTPLAALWKMVSWGQHVWPQFAGSKTKVRRGVTPARWKEWAWTPGCGPQFLWHWSFPPPFQYAVLPALGHTCEDVKRAQVHLQVHLGSHIHEDAGTSTNGVGSSWGSFNIGPFPRIIDS